ncbi:acyltransferase [Lysobacter sp. MMG2]|uniref:acyltransferase family protein n=1 Tax=Lysobacter sp. MMG2 TaxID=2801338 RepID=UPI001C24B7E6|nr:acyltransferase [Lysobacter sp. MMG2]MBU8977356.1 acyltransferase [Lysobacter sp. MMG2]
MQRLPGLDLLRAIAVVWVMLFHSFLVGGLGPDFKWLERYGWMGVDIFFVLSGFLIGRQVLAPLARGEALSFGDFYARRAWRILPAFAAVLAIYLAFPAWREAPGMAPWWQFATFTFNLLVDYGTQQAFSHAWSLCVEEHFYLVFPALAWALSRRPSMAKFVGVCVLVVVAGIAWRAGVWLHNDALDRPGPWFVEDLYYPTWCRLDGLLMGVVLATIAVYRPATWERMTARGNSFAVIGLLGMALAFWLFRERTGLLGNSIGWPVLSAAIACLVVAGAGTRSWIGRWSLPGVAWIAGISYSLYLSHKLVFHAVDTAWGEVLAGRGLLTFAVYALTTLAGGAALHYAVERPFLKLREHRRARTRLRLADATA